MPYQRRPTVGGGIAEIDIKLDLEDQSPGFVNLTEIPTLNVVIADGGEPPAGLTVTYYYVEAGPVETLHFEFLGAVARYIWADFSDSPDCDTITSTGSWTGTALYVEAWQQAVFTQPAECWLDMQHCPLMTELVFVGTDGHLTTRDCANLDTVDLDTLTGIHWWDTPDADLSTSDIDDIIALCVANGTNGRRLWLMGSGAPTLVGATNTQFSLNFGGSLPLGNGISFTIAGRTFGENISVGVPGFDSGYVWSVDSGASEDPLAVAAAYAAVIEANGFSVVDNADGTLAVTCDTAGPQGFKDNTAAAVGVGIAVAGTGNADLETLVTRNWDVGF